MADHSDQQLSAREMVRAHTYPLLAAISTISLLAITVLLIPQAVKTHRYNRCIDAQVPGCREPARRHLTREIELPQSGGALRRALAAVSTQLKLDKAKPA